MTFSRIHLHSFTQHHMWECIITHPGLQAESCLTPPQTSEICEIENKEVKHFTPHRTRNIKNTSFQVSSENLHMFLAILPFYSPSPPSFPEEPLGSPDWANPSTTRWVWQLEKVSFGRRWSPGSMSIWAIRSQLYGTPPKFNMEPENHGFQKDFPFPGTYFRVPC